MKTITKERIKEMMEEELETQKEESRKKTITRTEIKKMMEEEHSKLRAEGLHDEGLKDGVSDYLFNELSGWHDSAKAELQKYVEANGFDLTQEVLQALGAGLDPSYAGGQGGDDGQGVSPWTDDKVREARKRPLKRDREAFTRNQDMVAGLQKTITGYLKETGAKLDTRHKEVIERMSTRLMHVANSPMIKLSEGDATSRMITKLEDIGALISFGVKELDYESQPEVGERLERAEQMVQELWEEMHNLL